MTQKNKILNGVVWSFFEQLLKRGVSVLVTLLLARFLVPEDFGLLAMMTVFIAIGIAVMDSGINQAVIRKLEPDEAYFSTAFYANLALGVLAYTLLFIAAPFIADYYEELRLTLLLRVAGIVIIINSFQVIQVAMLSRALNFKAQMKASLPAAIISGLIAVLLAYQGFGVWALIVQTLLSALIAVIIYWWIQPWRPKLAFQLSALKEMYGFGYKLFLSGLLDTVAKNIYVLVIAKVFSTTEAGLFFFAGRIKEIVITQLVTSVQKVTYPALSKLQDDNVKLKESYRNVLQVITFILFPAMLMLAALAEPLFEFLFPERWLPAVPYLQLMCIAGMLYPLHAINLNILKVKGRSDLFLGLEVIKKTLLVIVLFISYRYGVIGILIGRGIQSLIAYVPNAYFSSQLINYKINEQIRDVSSNFILAIIVSASMYLLVGLLDLKPIFELIIVGILGLVVYILSAKIMKLHAYILAEKMIKERLSKKTSPA